MLLDTYFTISSSKNKEFVGNIQYCDAGKDILSYMNGGHQDYIYTDTMVMLPLEVFKTIIPMQKFYCYLRLQKDSVSH